MGEYVETCCCKLHARGLTHHNVLSSLLLAVWMTFPSLYSSNTLRRGTNSHFSYYRPYRGGGGAEKNRGTSV